MENKKQDMNWKEMLFCIPTTFILLLEAIGIPILSARYFGFAGFLLGIIITIFLLAFTTLLLIKTDYKYLRDKSSHKFDKTK